MTKKSLEAIIDNNIIGFKSERNRKIIKRKLCDGLTFEEVAEEFDMSVRQVKQILHDNKSVIENNSIL